MLPSRSFSFEFFPPKTAAGLDKLVDVARSFSALRPDYVSVTFGAGGSAREGTWQTVRRLMSTTGLSVVPHLSCVGVSRKEVTSILEQYRTIGVKRVVALRGDLPAAGASPGGDFRYANELVSFIKKEVGGFDVTVGCYPEFHPEAPDALADIKSFVRKVRAGADRAITQYFFNNDAYYSFVDSVRRQGVDVPVIVGLMPITDYSQIVKFSSFCGAEIPQWIRKRMEAFASDPASQRALGIEIATRQAQDLLAQSVPGIHFYTLNKSEASLRICRDLGLLAGAADDPVSAGHQNLGAAAEHDLDTPRFVS